MYRALVPLLLLCVGPGAQAQTDGGVSLVVDLSPGTRSSSPGNFASVGDTLFFAADNGFGRELWKSNGTAEGTVRVTVGTLQRSPPSLAERAITATGDAIYFFTEAPTELWRSDGTARGTVPVMDGAGIPFTSDNGQEVALGNALLHFGSRGAQFELWRAEGATARKGATLTGLGLGPFSRTVGGRVFFSQHTPEHGDELWSTDGTAAGTAMVKDLYAGPSDSSPEHFAAVGNALYFVAVGEGHGRELWKTDGTAEGTQPVWEGNAGPSPLTVVWMHGVGNKLVIGTFNTPSSHLWVSDGTSEGTVALASGGLAGLGPSGVRNVLATADRVYFSGSSTAAGEELWMTDGTPEGTGLVKDLRVGAEGSAPRDFTFSGGRLYFTAEDGGGTRDLWRSDGTPEGTFKVREGPLPGPYSPAMGGTANGPLLFAEEAPGIGVELWRSDGTAAGTAVLKDVGAGPASSDVAGLTVLGDALLFTATEGITGPRRLWRGEGTEGGARKLVDQSLPRYYSGLARLGRHVYFPVELPRGEQHLWRTDGTEAGTHPVETTPTRFSQLATSWAVMGGALYFNGWGDDGANELWRTDGTPGGTRRVKDINPQGDSGPTLLTGVGDVLYFVANDGVHGRELWRTDGTEQGTRLVKDIWPGSEAAMPYGGRMVAVGNVLYFPAADGVHGEELWKTDGTEAGTVMVADLVPGAGSAYPLQLRETGGKVWFTLFGPIVPQLWETDGTEAGTRQVEVRGVTGRLAVEFLLAESRGVKFLTAENNRSLWRTDGTEAGTWSVFRFPDSTPDPMGLIPFAERDGVVYFVTRTTEGDALWRTDGSADGTSRVGRVQGVIVKRDGLQWPEAINPVVRYRGHLLFAADDGAHGRELWRLPLASVTCPPFVTTEATSAAGAVVPFPDALLAEDAQPGTAVRYSTATGATFPLGVTPVTVEAADPGYPLSACTFTVNVRDTTAPQVQCPADLSVEEAEEGQGAAVSFSATASDAVTTSPLVTYTPAPGSVFRGRTRVEVHATDAAGNKGFCAFHVQVNPPSQSGCGCGSAQGPGSWAWLAGLGVWAWWGRRRTARSTRLASTGASPVQ